MAHEKMAPREVGPGAAVASAYGDIEPGRVVLLAKASQLGGAAAYYPVATAQLQNMPEDLRHKLIGGAGRPGYDGFEALAPVRYLLIHAGHPDVPEDLRRQLAGYFSVGYNSCDARDVICEASEHRDLQKENGKVVYQLDATPIPQVLETKGGGGLFQMMNGFPACFDAAAFAREPGTPFFGNNRAAGLVLGALNYDGLVPPGESAAGLGLGALYYDGLVPPGESAVPFVQTLSDNNRAAGQGTLYYDDVVPATENAAPFVGHIRAIEQEGALYYDGLVPAPDNVMAALSCPYSVQVRVDAAVGGMAGDRIAPGGQGSRRGYRGDNLSAVVGIVAASTAVTAVAAGAVGPVVAFGFFMVLLGGVSLAMASVRAP